MYNLKEILIEVDSDYQKLKELLNSQGLKVPINIDYACGYFNDNGLIGCGVLVGEMLQGIAVHAPYLGEGISAKIISHLMQKAVENGRENLYIITKASEVCPFLSLGFKEVAIAKNYGALLEWGQETIDQYTAKLKAIAQGKPSDAACIVMNANPFTLGHLHLITQAAKENPWVYVLVVEEEKSLFPFDVRLELIKQGTAEIKNLTIIAGGKYVISSLTFPSYFTREEDLAKAHARLDLQIFTRYIAPSLKVTTRYMGQEPYCPVTAIYNQAMEEILPKENIAIREIPRLEINNQIVSASKVRESIKRGIFDQLQNLVPETTYSFIGSLEAKAIVAKIQSSNSRH